MKKFKGAETRDRTSDMLNTGTRQTGIIETSEDLKEFEGDVTSTIERFKNKLNVTHRDSDDSAAVKAEPKVRVENLVSSSDLAQTSAREAMSKHVMQIMAEMRYQEN